MDAYFHIPIHRGYRKYLLFQTRDTIYQFRALPFGLSPAPWIFTKIMTEIKMLVHVMGINLCQYLDDWLIYSSSHDQWLRDTVQVLNLCHTMGLLIQDKKSELIPKLKFLFQFYLVSFQVTPSLDRYHKIKALIRSFLLNQGGCAHTWQILLGLFASTEKLVPLGRLHTREAQHCISQHWDFDALTSNLWIPLSPSAEEDLQWWKSANNVLRGAPVTLQNQTPSCSRMHRTSGGEHIGMH